MRRPWVGFPFCHPDQQRLYNRPLPLEPLVSFLLSRATPAAQESPPGAQTVHSAAQFRVGLEPQGRFQLGHCFGQLWTNFSRSRSGRPPRMPSSLTPSVRDPLAVSVRALVLHLRVDAGRGRRARPFHGRWRHGNRDAGARPQVCRHRAGPDLCDDRRQYRCALPQGPRRWLRPAGPDQDPDALGLASAAWEALGDTPRAVAALRQARSIPRNLAAEDIGPAHEQLKEPARLSRRLQPRRLRRGTPALRTQRKSASSSNWPPTRPMTGAP